MPPMFAYPPPAPTELQTFIPARVVVAMRLLDHLTKKTAPLVAANDISIEQFEGQPLDVEEKQAEVQACKTLAKYLDGKLGYDHFEERSKLEAKHGTNPGRMTTCPACCSASIASASCLICRGSGVVFILPAIAPGQ